MFQLTQAVANGSVKRDLSVIPPTFSNSTTTDFDSGDTAWMLTSTALVLFMTIPGLALFYGGMTRIQNVISVCMQIFSITCLITVCWLFFGYSLAFSPVGDGEAENQSGNPIYGAGSRLWLSGMNIDSYHQLAPTIPEAVYCAYQLTFAIITPALICGAFSDRMKFSSVVVFIILWHFIVYCPVAHWNWHPDGFLFQAGVLDYAGGNVVHVAAGISGLVAAIIIGNRRGFGDKSRFEPHNILLTFIGLSMLWVGWFGFNAGSAVSAGPRAAFALLMTQISAATAAVSWVITECIYKKSAQPSLLGAVNGAVAGLVCITPAAGFVNQTGAFMIGLFGGSLCFFGAMAKHYLGYDDALDAFGVHGVGGIVGGIATGFFATAQVGGFDGVYYAGLKVGGNQLAMQLYGIVVSGGWAGFFTFFILYAIQFTMGLRVSSDEEDAGLDSSYHGESLANETSYVPADSKTVDGVVIDGVATA